MRIVSGTLYALNIPFVESFSHSTKTRTFSDAIVLRLVAENGAVGYGEAIARPYVTGETVETCLDHMKNELWPDITQTEFSLLSSSDDFMKFLTLIDETLGERKTPGVIAWNAARAAFELALIDCFLKYQKISLSAVLAPKRTSVIYSGVITSSSVEKAIKLAKYFKLFSIKQMKVKIDGREDKERLMAIRETVGSDVSLRVDANGAFNEDRAVSVLKDIEAAKLDCVEQPIPRSHPRVLAKVKAQSPIPVMVDESLVTLKDAKDLIAEKACDLFNLRLSKCGGIFRTLKMAKMATDAGLRYQLGSQVGETAILSAAGRHVAAYLEDPVYVEGSYGTMLLTEDIGEERINFGHGGKAPLLKSEGLGIQVREDCLKKYALQTIEL